MPGGSVSLSVSGSIARLIIQNPPLNILTNDVRKALLKHVNHLAEHPEIKVALVESEGSTAFSAGSDVREFPNNEVGGVAKIRFEQHLLNRLAGLPQVVIAQLRGHVLGGGAELMLACDLRIADETARIGFPEIRLGALPVAGGIKRLVRDIGPVKAREMIFTGNSISAREALAFGLITAVVGVAELPAAAREAAAGLAEAPSDGIRLAKRCIDAAAGVSAIDTVEADAFAELYRGANLQEGVAAFLAKRRPRFDEPIESTAELP